MNISFLYCQEGFLGTRNRHFCLWRLPPGGMPLIDTDKSTTKEILDPVVKQPTIDFSLFISVCYGYQIDFNASNPVVFFLFSNNLVQTNVVSLTVLFALRSEADGFVYGVCQGHFLLDDY